MSISYLKVCSFVRAYDYIAMVMSEPNQSQKVHVQTITINMGFTELLS